MLLASIIINPKKKYKQEDSYYSKKTKKCGNESRRSYWFNSGEFKKKKVALTTAIQASNKNKCATRGSYSPSYLVYPSKLKHVPGNNI